MQAPPPEDPRQQEFLQRMHEFENEARKQGLYMEGFSLGASADPHEPQDHEDAPEFYAMATFLIGEQAFSNRVLDPPKHEEDTTFRTLTAGADPFDMLREEMQKKLEEGKDPFDE